MSTAIGALLTQNPRDAVEYLKARKVVATWFGQVWVLLVTGVCMEQNGPRALMDPLLRLDRTKDRAAGNPYLLMVSPADLSMVWNLPAILHFFLKQREIVARILDRLPWGDPLGLLFPFGESEVLPPQIMGTNVEGYNTVGFMFANKSKELDALRSRLPHNLILSGTSANLSKRRVARGSGHGFVGPLVRDFGGNKDVCIWMPPTVKPWTGMLGGRSTTLVMVLPDKVRVFDWLEVVGVREGSMSFLKVKRLLDGENATFREQEGGARRVLPYEYSLTQRLAAPVEFLRWQKKSKQGGFLPAEEAEGKVPSAH